LAEALDPVGQELCAALFAVAMPEPDRRERRGGSEAGENSRSLPALTGSAGLVVCILVNGLAGLPARRSQSFGNGIAKTCVVAGRRLAGRAALAADGGASSRGASSASF
jgi:hypothetical protein